MQQTKHGVSELTLSHFTLKYDEYKIVSGQLSYCGTYLASITQKREVVVFDLKNKTRFGLALAAPVRRIQFSPFEPELAIATESGSIERFDLRFPRMQCTRFAAVRSTALAYTRKNGTDILISGTETGHIAVFSVSNQPFPKKLFDHRVTKRAITALALNGDLLYGASEPGLLFSLELSRLGRPEAFKRLSVKDWDCYLLSSNPHTHMIAAGGYGPYVRLYTRNSAQPDLIATGLSYIHQIEFLTHNLIAVVGNGAIEVWNIDDLRRERRIDAPNGKALCTRMIENELMMILD